MKSKIDPYLHFKDKTRQAMEFYKVVFDGELSMSTFGEFNASKNKNEDKKIMHAMIKAKNGISFMASDTPKGMPFHPGDTITLSLSGDNSTELRGYWRKLATGGSIFQTLKKAPWGDTFGMLTDKFGIQWMVNITKPKK